MKKTNIQKTIHRFKQTYFTLNNGVIVCALVIGAGLAWGSVNAMQRNYTLEREVEVKKQELLVSELQAETLKFEKRYYESREYQELEARKRLNLSLPGEKVLVLPRTSQSAIDADKQTSTPRASASDVQPSPFTEWVEFLFGGRANQT